ncbi:hypothetical protein FB381_2510 [Nocardioides albertanoniae]|uniref:Uncharacterized protein n=1 Tax=Nocardioides albertanoniae TaxID=1175486 RepID=A0A543A7N9_9ACTN|nr:DUF6069 family protein [Nocardioides albertanoniae]TQL68615.1 hypothetical protein FB381_2510 [Nocardioides albertanoniae]
MSLHVPQHRQVPASTYTSWTRRPAPAAVEQVTAEERPEPVWPRGLVATAIAAVATTVVAVVAKTAGVDFASSAGDVPISAFPMFTVYCSLVGVIIAEVMIRVTTLPRSSFQITTIVLTGLSLVPVVLPVFEFDLTFVAVLCLTHVVAAAIVVPMISVRMVERRGLDLEPRGQHVR